MKYFQQRGGEFTSIFLASLFLLLSTQIVCHAQNQLQSLDVRIQRFPGVNRITVSTSNKIPVRSDLVLQAVSNQSAHQNSQVAYSKQLTIEAGMSSATVELPNFMEQQSWYEVRLFIEDNDNGRFDSSDYMRTSWQPAFFWYNALDAHLFVSSNIASTLDQKIVCSKKGQSPVVLGALGVKDPALLPNFQELVSLYSGYNAISSTAITSNLSFLQNAENYFSCIHPNEFFENWSSLTKFRSVFISVDDLNLLAQSVECLQALKYWTSAGGQLVVFGCGKKYENRDEVLSLFSSSDNVASFGQQESRWQVPNAAIKEIDGFVMDDSWNSSSNNNIVDPTVLPNGISAITESVVDQPMILKDQVCGNLILVASDLTDWQIKDWQFLYNTLFQQSSVAKVVGKSNLEGNISPAFRVPGIGKPPVLAFQILIALFVMAIGPGLYFVFSSAGRLYLLLIFVPLFSFLAVAVLFGYGIISDGFAIQGRVESVTLIDHRLNSAVTHARHVFYSGVSPGPCVFDGETIVVNSLTRTSPRSRYRLRRNGLTVTGGQIKARSPFQMTSVQCFLPENKISFAASGGADNDGKVTNSFENKIRIAAVHTEQGWFIARNIEPGAVAAADRIEPATLKTELRQLTNRIAAEASNRKSRFYDSYNQLEETEWGLGNETVSSLNSGDSLAHLVPKNCYLLVLDENELVVNPQPAATFGENQLHLIIGRW